VVDSCGVKPGDGRSEGETRAVMLGLCTRWLYRLGTRS
jgi:hypothetical protein